MPDTPRHSASVLAKAQYEFAAHIRSPQTQPAPTDVEDRRMAIYRRLFFNNVASLLASNFPVLRGLLSKQRWNALVREFYTEYRCQTPLFPEIAKEFLRYLQNGREARADDPSFLLELAHYEWVELALELDERELDDVQVDPEGDLVHGQPVLSPLAWPLSYRFPVQKIRPEYQPTEAPESATHLLVYRNRHDDVKFMRLNDVTRLLLQQLLESPQWSGERHLLAVAKAIGHPDSEQVVTTGTAVLEDLRRRDVILGTQPG